LTIILKNILIVKAGWGDWAGPGASGISPKILGIRNRLLKKVEDETLEKKKVRNT
jgi:U3 small nucleolar RNA-associated protein 14